MSVYISFEKMWYEWLYDFLKKDILEIISILQRKKEERLKFQKTYEIEKSLEYVWSIQEIREELKYIVFRILSYEICNWNDNFKEKFFWINSNDFFNIIKTHWLSKNEFDILFNVLYSDYWKIIQKLKKFFLVLLLELEKIYFHKCFLPFLFLE